MNPTVKRVHIVLPIGTLDRAHKLSIQEKQTLNAMLVQLIRLGIRYWDVRLRDAAELPHVPELED